MADKELTGALAGTIRRGKEAIANFDFRESDHNTMRLSTFRDKWLPYLHAYFKGDWVGKHEKGTPEYESCLEVIAFWNRRSEDNGQPSHPLKPTHIVDDGKLVYVFPSTLAGQEVRDPYQNFMNVVTSAIRAPTPGLMDAELQNGIGPNLLLNEDTEGLTRFQLIDAIFVNEGYVSLFSEPSNDVDEQTQPQTNPTSTSNTGWEDDDDDWEDA